MHALAVCGWNDASPDVLRALEQHASLRAVAVGDSRPARLVRARSATRLPCYQHLMEMARVATYDALLIESPELTAELAERAATRGADVLIRGDLLDAETLGAVAAITAAHGVSLAILRPVLRSAGYSFLAGLAASDDAWTPRFANLELRGDRAAPALLRDAAAAIARLCPQAPAHVSASAAGTLEDPEAIAAHLRFPDGALATLTARGARTPAMRLTVSAAAGVADLWCEDGETRLTITAADGDQETSVLPHGDLTELEAVRVASVRRGEALDALLANGEAATLRAIEVSLASGRTRPVEEPAPRAPLRLLEGGAQEPATPRAGRLHLVTT